MRFLQVLWDVVDTKLQISLPSMFRAIYRSTFALQALSTSKSFE
jgi:hypothetical protein